MKLEFNVEIEGDAPYYKDGTYIFMLKFNGFVASISLLDLGSGEVIENFDSIFLNMLGIKIGNFNSYKTKFKEFGIKL